MRVSMSSGCGVAGGASCWSLNMSLALRKPAARRAAAAATARANAKHPPHYNATTPHALSKYGTLLLKLVAGHSTCSLRWVNKWVAYDSGYIPNHPHALLSLSLSLSLARALSLSLSLSLGVYTFPRRPLPPRKTALTTPAIFPPA